ncbi:hypothetical protein, partial [Escherichia coli]|uniref:hypothetical protein n=1 Tax=Escherichia coli TaxID=562 RepID=UPI0025420D7E
MAKFAIRALALAAVACLVFDLTASEETTVGGYAEPSITTAATPSSFKDKVTGFVNNVKEGAENAYDSVSDKVSGAAHKLDEKRKEAVAGTKKLVSGVVDKIKQKYESFKQGDKESTEEE